MKIYLAARYSDKVIIAARKRELEAMGYDVVSTWTDEPDSPQVNLSDVADLVLTIYAARDCEEIRSADMMIFFSISPLEATKRGGRHVEFGMALSLGKKMLVCGPKENIFHYLPLIEQFDTWDQVKKRLLQ